MRSVQARAREGGCRSRPVAPGGTGGAMAPQILADKLTRGGRLCPSNYNWHPGFSDLPTALRRVGKMMPTYHMYPHSTAPSFSTFRPCFRVNFYSVALKLSCNMCVVPTRETFCGSQVAVLAWCTTMGCKPFWWCIFRRHASSEVAFALLSGYF